ncbi:MAG: sulfite exporter TauE/SafE family protein [Deferrisomatales bacterium]
MDHLTSYLLLFGVGFFAGTINIVAGGGSFLTLPLLIFLGLPAGVANATNRVGVLLQNVGAIWGFHNHGVMDWRSVGWAALPATAGAVVGTWAAVRVGDEAFQRILAFLMIAVTLWTLWDPLKGRSAPRAGQGTRLGVLAGGFFVVGIYGGFVQAGAGFFILAATTLAGLDLVRGNAVKVLTVFTLTAVSLSIFSWQGMVDWRLGLVLGLGNTLGGVLGVRLAVLKGHEWIKGVVTVTVIAFAVKLLVAG